MLPQVYKDAIANIESGGRYDLVGPYTGKYGNALGKYQVMSRILPEWSRAAFGRVVTPKEFLSNPDLQEQLFEHRFGGYVQKYGPNKAAQAWFAGEGGIGKNNRHDVYGTTPGHYEQLFDAYVKRHGGSGTEIATSVPLPQTRPNIDESASDFAETGDPVAQTAQNIAQGKTQMAGMSASDGWLERLIQKAIGQETGKATKAGKGGIIGENDADVTPPPNRVPAVRRTSEPTARQENMPSGGKGVPAPARNMLPADIETELLNGVPDMPKTYINGRNGANVGAALTVPVGVAAATAGQPQQNDGSILDALPDWLHSMISNAVTYGQTGSSPTNQVDAAPANDRLTKTAAQMGDEVDSGETVDPTDTEAVLLPRSRPEVTQQPPMPQRNPLRNQPRATNITNQAAAAAMGFDGSSREMMQAVQADSAGLGLQPQFQQYSPQAQMDAATMPIDISQFFGGGNG